MIQLSNQPLFITFDDNQRVPVLYGEQDKNLSHIEKECGVSISSRGNQVSIAGSPKKTELVANILRALYSQLENNDHITQADMDAAIRLEHLDKEEERQEIVNASIIKTTKKQIKPCTKNQREYVELMKKKELVFAAGPAGTGKTYLAVAMAVSKLLNHEIERIILSRPAVEAGEKLGFLPGDMKDKVDPYLQPLYDALNDMIPAERLAKYIEQKEIEIAPLAFMRGRTLTNACIILDEAQNTTSVQMKMFLTRLGEGSRMIVAGDLSQTDLPSEMKSGLRDALEKLSAIPDIGRVDFSVDDVIRHPLTAKIVKAYETKNKHKRWSELP